MSVDTTENDAEIARILTEEYDFESNLFNSNTPRSCSPIPSKKLKIEQESNQKNENYLQIDEDGEIAFILQIEEIVLSENKINEKNN